ncbi:MAG: hotdog fold domain-containing protein [Steroidobacteraceae bacterium]
MRARATLSQVPPDAGAAAATSDPAAPTRQELLVRADPSAFARRAGAPTSARRPRPPRSNRARCSSRSSAGYHADRSGSYLDEISEADPVFRVEGVAHPGWLLRFANWALSGSVRLGPWIHVSSTLWLLAPVHDGDQLEVRARVTDRFERSGHEFVDLEAVHLVAGRPVALVDHRAIWQPRPAAG